MIDTEAVIIELKPKNCREVKSSAEKERAVTVLFQHLMGVVDYGMFMLEQYKIVDEEDGFL